MPKPEYNSRQMNLMLPSFEERERWKALSKKARMSFSEWICCIVEKHLLDELEGPREPNLVRDQATLKDEIRKLHKELSEEKLKSERLETENFKLRHETFLRPINGPAQLPDRLVETLRSEGTWSNQALMQELGVTADDIKALNILVGQLHLLQDFGLVRESVKGWTWIP